MAYKGTSAAKALVVPMPPSTARGPSQAGRTHSSQRRTPSGPDRSTTSQPRSASTTMRSAILSLLHVLRNAGVSILVAWLFGYSFSVGNIFSGQGPDQQSHSSFVAANSTWFIVLFSVTVVVIVSLRLIPEEFIGSTSTADAQRISESPSVAVPGSRHGGAKFARRIWPHVMLAVAATIVFARFAAKVAPRLKLPMYFSTLCGFYVMIACDAHSRLLFRAETVRGRQLQLEKQQKAELERSRKEQSRRHRTFSSMSIRRISNATVHAAQIDTRAPAKTTGAEPTASRPTRRTEQVQQAANSPRRARADRLRFPHQLMR